MKSHMRPKVKALAVDAKAVSQTSEHILPLIISPLAAYFITLRASRLLTVCALQNVFKAFVKPALSSLLHYTDLLTILGGWDFFPPSKL